MSVQLSILQRFINHLQEERHFSDYTATSYGTDLVQYYGFLAQIETEEINADSATITIFIYKLQRNNYKPTSLARKIATLRSFYKWMTNQRIISQNPMLRVPSIKAMKNEVRTIDRDQLMTLLAMPDTKNVLGMRDLAIIQLICSTGVKCDELVHLSRQDIDITSDTPRLFIRSKRSRTQDLDTASVIALRRYLEASPQPNSDTPIPLFINKHGNGLSGRSVRRKIDKYLEMAGIDMSINPSTLRHTYARYLISKGEKLEDVAAKLGHVGTTTIKTTYSNYASLKGRHSKND
jgi:integrase/recombinase XerC